MSVIENPDLLAPMETTPEDAIDLHSCDALIILNQPIEIEDSVFQRLWHSSRIRVCADGGANRLHDYNTKYMPDFVIGDLDLLKPNMVQFYGKECTVKKQSSQYSTDFRKSVALADLFLGGGFDKKIDLFKKEIEECDDYDGVVRLRDKCCFNKRFLLVCIGALGGRLDHTLQSLTQLHKEYEQSPHISMKFLSRKELTFYIPKGSSFIDFSDKVGITCGLLPVFEPVVISTEGLKWDVADWESSMKGNVSSSNRVVRNIVHIQTSGPIAFSIGE